MWSVIVAGPKDATEMAFDMLFQVSLSITTEMSSVAGTSVPIILNCACSTEVQRVGVPGIDESQFSFRRIDHHRQDSAETPTAFSWVQTLADEERGSGSRCQGIVLSCHRKRKSCSMGNGREGVGGGGWSVLGGTRRDSRGSSRITRRF